LRGLSCVKRRTGLRPQLAGAAAASCACARCHSKPDTPAPPSHAPSLPLPLAPPQNRDRVGSSVGAAACMRLDERPPTPPDVRKCVAPRPLPRTPACGALRQCSAEP
jgi:hypothetical protein